jgi:preprotein translocase subunit SecF
VGVVRDVLRGDNDIDFSSWWPRLLIASAVAVVVSIGALALAGLNLGVEFTGGISVEASAPGVSVDQARSALADIGQSGAKVQIVGEDVLRVQSGDESAEAEQALRAAVADLAGTDASGVSVSTVSGSWGSDVTSQAVRALVVFLVLLLGYLSVRLDWKMAVAAIVAVFHDIVITVGIYALLQFEVSPGTVIAFLTILGYSIYDTVVVFDKVQEIEGRAGLAGRRTYTQMASAAMNEVLLRSVNTTITSLLPVLSLLVVGSWWLGAVTLSQFGIAIAVGLVVGAYSSIFVAAPVLAFLKEREPHNRAVRAKLEGGGPVVAGGVDDERPRRREPAPAERAATGSGTAGGSSGARAPAGAIPPRPRKKVRKPPPRR